MITATRWIDLAGVWQDARRIATERDRTHDYAGNLSRTRWAAHFMGALGEYVWSLEMKDRSPVVLSGADDGRDFRGVVDVKAKAYLGADLFLMVPADKDLGALYYVLAQLDMCGKRGRLVGYAHREEVAEAEVSLDWRVPTRCVPAERLHPVEELAA